MLSKKIARIWHIAWYDLDPSVWSLMGKSRGCTMESLAAFNEVFAFLPAASPWTLGALDRSSWGSRRWGGAGISAPGACLYLGQDRQPWRSSSDGNSSPHSATPLDDCLLLRDLGMCNTSLKSQPRLFCCRACAPLCLALVCLSEVARVWGNNVLDRSVWGQDCRQKPQTGHLFCISWENKKKQVGSANRPLCVMRLPFAVCRCCSVPGWHGAHAGLHSPKPHGSSCSCLAGPGSAFPWWRPPGQPAGWSPQTAPGTGADPPGSCQNKSFGEGRAWGTPLQGPSETSWYSRCWVEPERKAPWWEVGGRGSCRPGPLCPAPVCTVRVAYCSGRTWLRNTCPCYTAVHGTAWRWRPHVQNWWARGPTGS